MSLLGDESTGDSDLYSDEIPDLCLHSVFPIAVYCGPELILIYNQTMGLPAKEAWSEIYDDDLGPKFQDNVQATSSHDTSFHIQHVVRTGEHAIITLSNGCKAILLPVATSTGKNVLTSVMICGINPRRALDLVLIGFILNSSL
ncbi:29178_t:CDS:2 [Gigaspora margarita]|uniref:29178_t:CDS:1 n=1 Tax=Gigaspora margarita TaxID=4874 RepID=A0ABM8VYJ0_GIGMA|nr:29178_t:CDS:2 [Gigaspora margarita]